MRRKYRRGVEQHPKLKYGFFIELNQKAIVKTMYEDDDYIVGNHNYGLASGMYDVLNKIAVDSHLGRGGATPQVVKPFMGY